jgi:hypothetical protein
VQPTLPHHPRHRGPDGGRGDAEGREQAHEGRYGGPSTAGTEMVAIEIKEGGPGLHGRLL